LYQFLKDELRKLLIDDNQLNINVNSTFVILVVGVNGAGKTTTIGKLAKSFQNQGKSVMLAAGDTFRAAAVEQLKVWGERNEIPVVAQDTGADAASVIYDAYESARAKNIDILIADTAGRLHTQGNLMQELEKIKRVLKKHNENAPHETMLVIDGGSGQNAINQAKEFNKTIGLSGICITKLDGTAKGGVVFAISDELKLPVRYIGVGEGINDLKPFNAKKFVDALFE
jgi:fused signal recognition particle receptor